MESESDGVESEQISEAFICCVCLDLLYKPIVLACGHMSCFWCVHRSMSGRHESHCPMCRHPYHHFPTICQMLHFLLLKMYPVAYKKRETQILGEEKKMGFFSPQFDALVCRSHTNKELNHLNDLGQSSTKCFKDSLSTDLCSTRNREPYVNMEQLESISFSRDNGTSTPKQLSTRTFGSTGTVAVEEKNTPQRNCNGTCEQVSNADLLCAACKQLLFQPIVLHCGHVYCETCIIISADKAPRCKVCQSPHPKGFPKVCLEFDHFLEEQFPKEYALRRGPQLKQVHFQRESPTTCSTEAGKQGILFPFPTGENLLPWLGDHRSKVHVGAGCDSCGMFPIIGDRYRCKDCVEAIGFDLCGYCYNTRSKLPGRFNQQHTPEHKFEIVKSNFIHKILLRLLRRQLEDGSLAPILSNDASENPGNVFPSTLSNDAQESAEIGSSAPVTSSDSEEDQNDTHLAM